MPLQDDVHYGVGLGLPALTAPELTTLNRDAEAANREQNIRRQMIDEIENSGASKQWNCRKGIPAAPEIE